MKKYTLGESLDRKFKALAENINESDIPSLCDICEEDDDKSLVREKEKSFAEKAWDLSRIIYEMNNEEVLETWLYYWPDGCDFEDCDDYFGTKKSYQELFNVFKQCYKAFHEDGLYTKDWEVVDLAHKMDKELNLKPIVNYYRQLKEDKSWNTSSRYNSQYSYKSNDELEYVFWETFNSNKRNVANAQKNGLTYEFDTIAGPVWSGKWKDLNRFCNELGYELHPDYLFDKCECDIATIEDISDKDLKEYHGRIYNLSQSDREYAPILKKVISEIKDRNLKID